MSIDKFGPHRIEHWCRERNLSYLIEDGNTYHLEFTASGGCPASGLLLGAQGADLTTLSFTMFAQATYPGSTLDRLRGVAASWNAGFLWPNAYATRAHDGGVRLIGRTGWPFATGVHEELLDEFITRNFNATRDLLIQGHAAATAGDGIT
jgi:hypothetical protein